MIFEKLSKIKNIKLTDNILINIYKILLIYRNCIIHHKDKIKIENSNIIASYNNKNDKYTCEIEIDIINIIATISINIICNKIKNYYDMSIARTLYDDIIKSIKVEKNGKNVLDNVYGFKLKNFYRLTYYDKNFIVGYYYIIFPIERDIKEMIKLDHFRGIDYEIYINKILYRIPIEALDGGVKIRKNELKKWKISSSPSTSEA